MQGVPLSSDGGVAFSEQEAWLDIFAPVTWPTESAKRKLKAAVAQPIADVVVATVHKCNGRENADATP